eukprot:6284136-Amphidinium_carterae.1
MQSKAEPVRRHMAHFETLRKESQFRLNSTGQSLRFTSEAPLKEVEPELSSTREAASIRPEALWVAVLHTTGPQPYETDPEV